MNSASETAAAAGTNGRTLSPKRARRREIKAQGSIDTKQPLATFCAVDPMPADVQMWPLESTAWLDPELSLLLPASAGLRVERRSGMLLPALFPITVVAHAGSQALEAQPTEAAAPALALPQSDVRPLGWDARVAAKAEEVR